MKCSIPLKDIQISTDMFTAAQMCCMLSNYFQKTEKNGLAIGLSSTSSGSCTLAVGESWYFGPVVSTMNVHDLNQIDLSSFPEAAIERDVYEVSGDIGRINITEFGFDMPVNADDCIVWSRSCNCFVVDNSIQPTQICSIAQLNDIEYINPPMAFKVIDNGILHNKLAVFPGMQLQVEKYLIGSEYHRRWAPRPTHAMALGNGAVAFNGAVAAGNAAFAANGGLAYGAWTTVINGGTHAIAYAPYSRVNGSGKTFGYNSHIEGARCQTGLPEKLGTNSAGSHAHAEGSETTAIGRMSHSEGHQTYAIGDCSHTEGYQTSALASYSHAEGVRATSLCSFSHAEGCGTSAVGMYAHAEGYNSIAEGTASHAAGSRAYAGGEGSFALGYAMSVDTSGYHSIGMGSNGCIKSGGSFLWNGNDTYVSDNGEGTFTVNPNGGINGFYIKDTSLSTIIDSSISSAISSSMSFDFKPLSGLQIDFNATPISAMLSIVLEALGATLQ